MEFWGAEVKNGGSLKVQPGEGKVLHLSQACLGEVKKGNDYIRLYVQTNGQKFVIGMLSPERFPHLNLDLVFQDEFALSHDLKLGSVHFAGYKADDPLSAVDENETDDDEELVPLDAFNNGKLEASDSKPSTSKAIAGVKPEGEGKSKVKIVEPGKDVKKNEEDNETEDDDDDDDDDEAVDEKEEDMAMLDTGSEDDSDEEEGSDEETPKKPSPGKKRPWESTLKTSVPEKKAKFSTPPQKADGKKVVGHVATPHPAKQAQAGKTPANAEKSNKQTPTKSFTCSSCSKLFGSEQAVQSHSKAKHGAK